MHERALMTDLVREIDSVARADEAVRVTRVAVRLGALSHFTPENFREHFAQASHGTIAEGAAIDAVLEQDLDAPRATGVVLESVEVELVDDGGAADVHRRRRLPRGAA